MKNVKLAAYVFSITLVLLMGGMVFAILRGESTRTIVKRVEVQQKTCFERPKKCRRTVLGRGHRNVAPHSKQRSSGQPRLQSRQHPSPGHSPQHQIKGGEPSNPPPGNSQPPSSPVDSGGDGEAAAPEPEIRVGPVEVDVPDVLPLPLPKVNVPLPLLNP